MTEPRVFHWVRRNLFSTPFNGALTLACLWLLWVSLAPVIDWAILSADWTGSGRADCSRDGACWVFVSVRLEQFTYGFFPEGERWRVNLAALIVIAFAVPVFHRRFRRKGLWLGCFVIAMPLLAFVLLAGGAFGLSPVGTDKWGGLMLTVVVAGVGILASLPIGIVLALGRQSELPVIRGLSTAFIEIWRGVPLITVLFMTAVMLPLFLPGGVSFDKLARALIGVSLFAGAYMAEVVRGGLQALPAGQVEAAKSLGMGYWQTTFSIVLPQALKTVIPGIVNVFIGLFKDTTLVLIIGLFDLLGIIKSALTDAEWLGFALEGYVFAAVVFWVACFAMSRYSLRLERRDDDRDVQRNPSVRQEL